MRTIRVLSPVVSSTVSQSAARPLPATLAGRTVAFLDNAKANFDRLASEMEARLRAEHGLGRAIYVRKPNAATPAPPEILAALEAADLVVTGAAD